MRVAVRFDATDEQRNALACLLAGKRVARLATRDDLTAYLMGAVEALTQSAPASPTAPEVSPRAAPPAAAIVVAAPVPAALRGLTEAEAREAQRLRAAGKPEGFIVGWIKASRRMFGGRLSASRT